MIGLGIDRVEGDGVTNKSTISMAWVPPCVFYIPRGALSLGIKKVLDSHIVHRYRSETIKGLPGQRFPLLQVEY
jgi:hypothetical protein